MFGTFILEPVPHRNRPARATCTGAGRAHGDSHRARFDKPTACITVTCQTEMHNSCLCPKRLRRGRAPMRGGGRRRPRALVRTLATPPPQLLQRPWALNAAAARSELRAPTELQNLSLRAGKRGGTANALNARTQQTEPNPIRTTIHTPYSNQTKPKHVGLLALTYARCALAGMRTHRTGP